MKTIYFVRHGESEGNAGPFLASPTSPLTEKGIQQAKFIANRAKKLPFELIISSAMTRAKETAEEISKETEKPIEYSDLFAERRRPTEIYGKPKDDPRVLQICQSVIDNFHISDYHFSNEENFTDLKERAEKALDHLLNRPEEKILVVTHGFFMRIVVAYIIFGEVLTSYECERCIEKFYTENTGITVISYDNKNEWRLGTWNDHAHLG